MENFVAGDLRIESVDGGPGGPIILQLSGKSTDRQPGKLLAPYFMGVLALAAGQGSPVEAHFEGLEHMNSSTVTAIIQLIADARSAGVQLILVYDAKQKGQKLSFEALRVFVRPDDLLRLRTA